MTIECNADAGHACDANDGEPCDRCAANAAYWAALYVSTPESARRLDRMTAGQLEVELRDAGRACWGSGAHLIDPNHPSRKDNR